MVSMWQTDSVAIKVERTINWARRRDEAVAFIQDASWWAVGSP